MFDKNQLKGNNMYLANSLQSRMTNEPEAVRATLRENSGIAALRVEILEIK